MDARPFYDSGVRFRSPKSEEGECDEGEASRIIKDFWAAGDDDRLFVMTHRIRLRSSSSSAQRQLCISVGSG